MDKRSLIATYFRQQHELSCPDIVFSNQFDKSILISKNQKRIDSPTSVEKKSRRLQPIAKPADSTRSISSRLSHLKPVDQILEKRSEKKPTVTTESLISVEEIYSKKRACLAELYRAGCTGCHLAKCRKNFVFGSGHADASIVIIGEAPGADEDDQGLPFVGAAGQLLTKMLNAVELDRNKHVFITNILKCRPPQNRNPETAEIVSCLPLLKRQLEIIKPKVLLLLGRIAAHSLLEKTEGVAKLRSEMHDYNGIPTLVTYHPAALLRNAELKRPAWEDLQKLQKLLTDFGVYDLSK